MPLDDTRDRGEPDDPATELVRALTRAVLKLLVDQLLDDREFMAKVHAIVCAYVQATMDGDQ